MTKVIRNFVALAMALVAVESAQATGGFLCKTYWPNGKLQLDFGGWVPRSIEPGEANFAMITHVAAFAEDGITMEKEFERRSDRVEIAKEGGDGRVISAKGKLLGGTFELNADGDLIRTYVQKNGKSVTYQSKAKCFID